MKNDPSIKKIQQIERKSDIIDEQNLITAAAIANEISSKSSAAAAAAAVSTKQAIYLEKSAVSEQFDNKSSFFKSLFSECFLFVVSTVLFLFLS